MSSASIGYFGPYRLLNVVNTGQSSRLWQAYDDQNRKFVGIKTLLDQYTKQKDQIQILKWEYDVASKFSHPKLIHVFEFGWYQKTPYLAMEWFSAPNLKMWINRGYTQYCTYLPKLMPQMVEALFYLHQQGWVHRDVKPDNFLFNNESGEMKLIDFALARRIAKGLAKLFAMKSKTQGTASYMSPEQIRGLPPSQQADIYSLGCTFYELLTTRLPFAGESMSDLLNKHLAMLPPPVSQRNKNITPEFVAILKMMLAKKPEDRPKSTDELLKMIHGVRIFRRSPIPEDVV
ncbi:MAG: serine/threonine protein kinase [Planctomycetaceae bacterium]|jgi:serine/threonine protein kinase|nr:serine/threonine protein kinase [Planctomycetaceae bacterium]